jgi:hypothetical protein
MSKNTKLYNDFAAKGFQTSKTESLDAVAVANAIAESTVEAVSIQEMQEFFDAYRKPYMLAKDDHDNHTARLWAKAWNSASSAVSRHLKVKHGLQPEWKKIGLGSGQFRLQPKLEASKELREKKAAEVAQHELDLSRFKQEQAQSQRAFELERSLTDLVAEINKLIENSSHKRGIVIGALITEEFTSADLEADRIAAQHAIAVEADAMVAFAEQDAANAADAAAAQAQATGTDG